MARITGPVCRLCRREGEKLYLKGEKCYTKCTLERRPNPPGVHGRVRRMSEYGLQLREKQKAKRFYGVLERQFKNYFERAAKARGATGTMLMTFLERRLDNVVYRLGFASSRREARQLVVHGHFLVNSKKVDRPSYLVNPGDVIEVREKSRNLAKFKARAEALADYRPPAWLQLDESKFKGTVLRLPTREEIDAPVNERLIVELYSK
ncbi:MAG: 30S ribosomal protein S4 [Firmicutes bacterium]|nr:30S ribosomal protein S4 [Candidatus Fermentithermobacillaceae bacterium]